MKPHLAIRQHYGESQVIEDLVSIWGSNLVSAFLPRDFIVDGSNNITTPVARIGPNGANATANRFTLTDLVNRKAMTASTLDEKSITVSVACKTIIAIATAPTLPLTNYSTLVKLGDSLDEILTGNTGTSSWFLAGNYKDGSASNIISSGLHIYEGFNNSTTSTQYRVGGGSAAGRVWQASILGWFGLNTTQTLEQRVNSLRCIARYYNFTDQEILTMQMKAIFGSSILQMIIADDVVVDGSNNITSWPARVGTTSTPLGSEYSVRSTVLGKRSAVFTRSDTGTQALSMASGVKCNAVVARFDGAIPISGYAGLIGGQSLRLIVLGGSSDWFGGGTYKDNVLSSTLDNNPHLWLQQSPTADANSFGIGGDYNSINYTWTGPIWFALQLNAEPTSDQRTLMYNVLKSYYRFIP